MFSRLVLISLAVIVSTVHGAPQFPNFQQQQPQFQAPPQFNQQQQYPFPQAQGFGPQQAPQFQAPPQFQPQPQASQPDPMAPEPGTPQPKINWGQCPQLEPTLTEKMKKANVITKCLEVTPIPQNLTRDSVERHREAVAACALQMEGWFTPEITYRYEKAETEIKSKRLPAVVEQKVLGYHQQCKQEAEEKYPHSTQTVIHQIQLYQACMDYFISEACGIEVIMSQPQQYSPQNQGFQG